MINALKLQIFTCSHQFFVNIIGNIVGNLLVGGNFGHSVFTSVVSIPICVIKLMSSIVIQ